MKTLPSRRVLATIMALAIGSQVVIPTTASAQDDAGECPKAYVVAVRGSDETRVSPRSYGNEKFVSNGHEGQTLERMFKGFVETVPGAMDDVQVVGVDYPAAGVSSIAKLASLEEWMRGAFNEYTVSINTGGTQAAHAYATARNESECWDAEMIYTGYSQGAWSARIAEGSLPRAYPSFGSLYVGDPLHSNADRAYSIGGALGVGIRADDNAKHPTRAEKRIAYCEQGDVVCDTTGSLSAEDSGAVRKKWGWADLNTIHTAATLGEATERLIKTKIDIHTSYFTGRNSTADAHEKLVAQHFGNWINSIERPTEGGETGTSSVPQETMIVIDTTGSMGDDIDDAKASASEIADALLKAHPESRVGLVEYRDWGSAYFTSDGSESPAAVVRAPLTRDFNQFNDALQALRATGGGDYPEAVYSGIYAGLGADWAENSKRSVIVIGDAPAHNPEPVSGLTEAHIIDIARGIAEVDTSRIAHFYSDTQGATEDEKAPTSIYFVSNDPSVVRTMEPLVTTTGGQSFGYDGANAAQAILNAAEAVALRPVAQLTISPEVVAGQDVSLSVALSEVKVDGPATFIVTTSDGQRLEVGHNELGTLNFNAPGVHTVSLEVTDATGASSTTNVTVNARDEAELRGEFNAESEAAYERLMDAAEEEVVELSGGDEPPASGSSVLDQFGDSVKIILALGALGGLIATLIHQFTPFLAPHLNNMISPASRP